MKLRSLSLIFASTCWIAITQPSPAQSAVAPDPFAAPPANDSTGRTKSTGPAADSGSVDPFAAPEEGIAKHKIKSQAPAGVTADPFKAGGVETNPKSPPEIAIASLTPVIRVEAFSLPLPDARKAIVSHPAQEELYGWLDTEVDKENGSTKLELFTVLCTKSGQLTKVDEITEFPFATEFDPPQIATEFVSPLQKDPQGEPTSPHTNATPTTYEYRNLGFSIEMEVSLGDDSETLSMQVAPVLTKLSSLEKMTPNGDLAYPQFLEQKLTSTISTKIGIPTLIGSFNPPENPAANNPEKRVWFLFCTATKQ